MPPASGGVKGAGSMDGATVGAVVAEPAGISTCIGAPAIRGHDVG